MITYTDYLEWIVNDRYKTENFLERELLYDTDDIEKHLLGFAELDEVIESMKEAVVVQINVFPNLKGNSYLLSEDKKWLSIKFHEYSTEVIKRILENLNSVRFLELECEESMLPNELFQLLELEYLCISSIHSFATMPNSGLKLIQEEISQLTKMRYLEIECTSLMELPRNIVKLNKLKGLVIAETEIEELPEGFGQLSQLECLKIYDCKIKKIPSEIFLLTGLKQLELDDCLIEDIPTSIGALKNLRVLSFYRCQKLVRIPEDIGELVNLEVLWLNHSKVKELPLELNKLCKLKKLWLGDTSIRKLPVFNEKIRLEYLELDNTVLERIPEELISSELIASENLSIENTKLLCQPISLFYHDYDFIKAYYDEPKIHLNETKVVFLGDGEAGKSHIIERIFNGGEILPSFQQQSTPGIDIKKENYQIGTENMCLQFWDFGGQEIMHSMHRFFLTERTLYVIVLNARDNTQDERAKYWLNNIKSFASGCPVILVLNKIDQNQSGSLNETLLRSDYPQIEHVMKMSAKEDSKEQFDVLLDTILKSVKEFDSYAMEFPKSWNHIKTELTEMNAHYITDEVYRNICTSNGVEDQNIQDWLLEWFHDLGVSFNYKKKDILLGGYMVLKPKWITNAIYNILFNGKDCSMNGIIKMKDIAEILQNPTKTVDPAIKYKIEELPYILGVMRRFEISYQMNQDNEFIPMMCDKNENAEAASFLNQDNILEYFMKYEYLPNNVLHKLMIKMRNDIDGDKIWLTGVIFRSQDNTASALVRMHDDKIEIFVRENQEGLCQAYAYFQNIRNHLMGINKELNLKVKNYVVYKENGVGEAFGYDKLLKQLKAKIEEAFSEKFEKLIKIKDILRIVEGEDRADYIKFLCEQANSIDTDSILHEVDEQAMQKKLFEDIKKACILEIGNTHSMVTKFEDDRNDNIRNMLIMAGYRVADQSRNGLAPGGKGAGELDLLIRRSNGTPLGILEALCVKGVVKKAIKAHFDKLFQYDTAGNKYNYLVLYVQVKDFHAFYRKYKTYVEDECDLKYRVQDTKEMETEFAVLRVIRTRHVREGKTVFVYHLLNHIQPECES